MIHDNPRVALDCGGDGDMEDDSEMAADEEVEEEGDEDGIPGSMVRFGSCKN